MLDANDHRGSAGGSCTAAFVPGAVAGVGGPGPRRRRPAGCPLAGASAPLAVGSSEERVDRPPGGTETMREPEDDRAR